MSSTKRGSSRQFQDNYATPAWAVHRLLEKVTLPGGIWYEPSAGEGAIIRAVNEVRTDVHWAAGELRDECAPLLTDLVGRDNLYMGDFLQAGAKNLLSLQGRNRTGVLFDVIIGNPPFFLAQEFIEKAFQWAHIVVLLLRLNYWETTKRQPFMAKFAPDTNVLPERPSYEGKGTDSIAYAWKVWWELRERSEGVIRVLASTPKEVRKQHKLDNEAVKRSLVVPGVPLVAQDIIEEPSNERQERDEYEEESV